MPAQGVFFDRGADFGLIETLLWRRESGYWLADGHFARLAGSAAALGFVFSPERFDATLAQACAGADAAALRVKLVLRRDGSFEMAAAPFTCSPPAKIWRVAVAPV